MTISLRLLLVTTQTGDWQVVKCNGMCTHLQQSVKHSRTFFQKLGTLASNMLSRASFKFSDMMMVPSMASFKSLRVLRTVDITFCILSTSCLRKMFSGFRWSIFRRRSLTWSKITMPFSKSHSWPISDEWEEPNDTYFVWYVVWGQFFFHLRR